VIVLLAVLAALLAAPAAAENAASGQVESKSWKVPLEDAYAFRDDASFGEGRVIVVAVSNWEFGEESLDRYYDRRYVLNEFFADEETRVVYFEFSPDGKYLGYSYFFEGGDGCGWCGGGDVRSAVKAHAGRIAGKLAKQDDDGLSFDLSFDVPIASDDYGAKQSAGGGEPGKAWLSWHAAAEAGDRKALRALAGPTIAAAWKKAEGDGRLDGYLKFLTEDRPRTGHVREAFVKGDRAVVLVAGDSPVLGKMHGEVQMVREGGSWRVDGETLQLGAPEPIR